MKMCDSHVIPARKGEAALSLHSSDFKFPPYNRIVEEHPVNSALF
jgi:hypothetical protein